MSVSSTDRIDCFHALQRVTLELYETAFEIGGLGHHLSEELINVPVSFHVVCFETDWDRESRSACSTQRIRGTLSKGTAKLWVRGRAVRGRKWTEFNERFQVWLGFINCSEIGELEYNNRLVSSEEALKSSKLAYLGVDIWIIYI